MKNRNYWRSTAVGLAAATTAAALGVTGSYAQTPTVARTEVESSTGRAGPLNGLFDGVSGRFGQDLKRQILLVDCAERAESPRPQQFGEERANAALGWCVALYGKGPKP